MAKRISTGAGTHIGRRIGAFLSQTWGNDIDVVLQRGQQMSGPLVRAFLDHFVVNRLAASIWPPLAILAALLAIRAVPQAWLVPEARRTLIGLLVLFAIAWSVYGIIVGSIAAWPHVRLWLVTRLGPIRHVRLLIYNLIRTYHEAFLAGAVGPGFFGDVLEASIASLQQERNLSAARIAFAFADHLAPIVVRHLCFRLALIVGPVIAGLLYYRLEIYPDVILRDTNIHPWSIPLYPIALLIDLLAHTHLRQSLP